MTAHHSTCLCIALIAATACGGSGQTPRTQPSTVPLSTVPLSTASLAVDSTEALAPIFAEPENVGPVRFALLGPLDAVPGSNIHASLDHDYLASLGGEKQAVLREGQSVHVAGKAMSVTTAFATAAMVDLVAHYRALFGREELDGKVAYAYAEFDVAAATEALALFGSDDGAAVWLNGERVHHMVADRGIDPNSDRFDVKLQQGRNRVLIKVDNGWGGWAFALRLYDQEGQRRLAALAARQELEALNPGPLDDRFLLDDEFPRVVFRNAELKNEVFGENEPTVQWFGPNLEPATHPAPLGRYLAVVEATTRDGYTYRRMLAFAKVPNDTVPWFPVPPMSDSGALIPLPDNVKANAAQHRELSRHVWHGGLDSLWRGESAAIAAAALYELRDERGSGTPPSTHALRGHEPAWLESGFVKNAERQLALRMKLEGRTPAAFAPPTALVEKAGELRPGSEQGAGMKPGATARLRKVAREWAKTDPSGFVVLVSRRGTVFMHEGFNGFEKDTAFFPASIGKSIAGLTIARAVEQGLLEFDQPVFGVLPEWDTEKTRAVTFRNCVNHVSGLKGHRSHGGLFNAYVDNALLIQDAVFTEPGTVFRYNGDGFNLAGRALELRTGKSIFRLLHEHLQAPFDEPVTQFDLGVGDAFTAQYLAKVGQLFLQDGAYGGHRLFEPGFMKRLYPRPIGESAPKLINKETEVGIGLTWMRDGEGDGRSGFLGPNVLGHGSGSGSMWRIALDHELVIVVGRSKFEDWNTNEEWIRKFAAAVAENLAN